MKDSVGGARERADDILLFRWNKRTSEQSELYSDVESTNTFEVWTSNPYQTRTGIQRSESGSEARSSRMSAG